MLPLLTVKHLSIEAREDDKQMLIVNDISFTLKRGEVLGIIGESGAGKSTVGLAVMGYTRSGCRVVSGSILFDDLDVLNASEELTRKLRGVRIAYVAQSAAASFNPSHRLIHQFAEGPVQHGVMSFSEAQKEAIELYRRFLLPSPESIGRRFPHQVSGGQLQRAMVAMAMSCGPEIVIFDEPTTGLDVTTQVEVLAAIKEVVKQQNMAAIYISHDLALVVQLADYIMVLRHGELVEEQTSRELLRAPQKEYTRQLLSVRSGRREKDQSETGIRTILEVENLSASYTPGVNVLEDIDLKVEQGKTIAIVGESGSVKTSLA